MSLISRMKAGETLFTAWTGLPEPLTIELVAGLGFDAVTLDMQHGGHNEESVLRCLASVIAAGKHAVVRIPVGRFDAASRALDFGAEAVIAPMVNSVADAQAFADSMKYPPLGRRSWGPAFAANRYGMDDAKSWLHEQNGKTAALAMVETREAFDALDGILAVEGIDGIFLGPSDFTIAWTNGGEVASSRKDLADAIRHVGERTLAAGKVAAIYNNDPAEVGLHASWGFRMQALASEQKLMTVGAAQLFAEARTTLK